MTLLNTNSGTTPCPECGEPMGLVTWVGEKPACPSCAGASTTGRPLGRPRRNDRQECAHDALERSLPPNQRGGPHMLVCNCPKCRIHC